MRVVQTIQACHVTKQIRRSRQRLLPDVLLMGLYSAELRQIRENSADDRAPSRDNIGTVCSTVTTPGDTVLGQIQRITM